MPGDGIVPEHVWKVDEIATGVVSCSIVALHAPYLNIQERLCELPRHEGPPKFWLNILGKLLSGARIAKICSEHSNSS